MHAFSKRWLSRLASIAVVLAVTACAAPTVLNTQWADPQFKAKPIRSILVVGIIKSSADRRKYEDTMVEQLAGRGVRAVPSYRFSPEDGAVPQETMQKAVRESGATGVLLTRVVNVSQSVQVVPGMYMGPPMGYGFGGFYGYYGGMWASSYYSPPVIQTHENVTADTRLFEAKDFALVWSGSTTTTVGFDSTATIIKQFSTLITGALAKDGLI